MHVPDHLIHNSAQLVAGLSAVGVLTAVAVDLRRRPTDRTEGTALSRLLRGADRPGPQLATAALVFALQMVNFPVLPGTSGHLLGGASAVALIGLVELLLAVAAVVTTQALVFADGGVGVMGVNLWLIALVPVAVAVGVQRLVSTREHRQPCTVVGACGRRCGGGSTRRIAGFRRAVLAPAGTGSALGEVTSAMVGVHLAIGLGEAALTLGVLAAVVHLPAAVAGSPAGWPDRRHQWVVAGPRLAGGWPDLGSPAGGRIRPEVDLGGCVRLCRRTVAPGAARGRRARAGRHRPGVRGRRAGVDPVRGTTGRLRRRGAAGAAVGVARRRPGHPCQLRRRRVAPAPTQGTRRNTSGPRASTTSGSAPDPTDSSG